MAITEWQHVAISMRFCVMSVNINRFIIDIITMKQYHLRYLKVLFQQAFFIKMSNKALNRVLKLFIEEVKQI